MYRSKYVILATFWWILATTGNIIRNEDICGSHNGRRLYLELGERGILYAKNVIFVRDSPKQPVSRLYGTSNSNSSHYQCSLELVTCPSCMIVVIFKHIALSHHCDDGGVVMDNPCRCDYVWLTEPPYDYVSGSPFCGSYAPITYRSSTRTLSINLFYSQSHKHAFTIEYTAERNRLHLKGTEMTPGVLTKGSNGTGGGILTSPFFPAQYPRDLGLEYMITCPDETPSCRIRLLFSDFQLATVSIMEFYDWNGQRLDVSSGARFRPPFIVSSGPSLLIRFYANGGAGLGYKAFYSFVIGHKSVQPITDCGGYVENLGGAITMINMVHQGVKTYDCVWLIRPPRNFLHMKTHMYLKVVDFGNMAGNTELIIKQGPTSAMMALEVIRHPMNQLQPLRYREHIAPIVSGFHVSLRGAFGPSSHLAIAYAAFSYTDCFEDSDFLCQNHRCIPSQLNCDDIDHCGDNSDEPATCFRDWEMQPRDRKWHMNKANYYFRKIDSYPNLTTATLVFIISSLGLIILISALIVLLYRIGARARQQRELQSRLETISELLDGARIDEISISDDPPGYEAPPGYEEIAKLVLQKKKAQCSSRESCNRSSTCQHDDEDANSSTFLVVDGANNRGGQTAPIVSGNDRRTSRIPESPPPPYITPPETISKALNLAALSASMRQICPVRRTWLRRSAQYPSSTSDARPSVGNSSSFTDVEDTYLTDCIATDTNWISESSPQDTQVVREETAQENTTEALEGNSRHVSEENCDEAANGTVDGRSTGCSCEGACGCASSNFSPQDLPADNLSTSGTLMSVNDTSQSDQMAIASSSRGRTDDDQEEDFSISRNTIVKLLSSKLTSASYHSANSTATSSPCETLRYSSRKPSRGSCVTGISTISACNSYDKLQDEFEIVSEVASSVGCITNPSTVTNTPRNIVGGRGRLGNRQYSSCDLDSLYEGMRILDTYLARRSLSIDHESQQSVAVMLFGTPEHGSARDRVASSQQTRRRRYMHARIWSSSENAFD